MIRVILTSCCSLLLIFNVISQSKPVVTSISKTTARPGEDISILGSNFTSDCIVYFGNSQATSVNINSATQISVTVPVNASADYISVTSISTELSSKSSQIFTPSFGGNTFLESRLGDQVSIEEDHDGVSQKLIWDLCLCDLNLDNFLDAVTTHRESSGLNIYENKSTSDAINFELATLSGGADNPINIGNDKSNIIKCKDLNGDGKSDLIYTTVTSEVYSVRVFKNNSSSGGNISLENVLSFRLPQKNDGSNRSAYGLSIEDIDGDGKYDLVVGSDTEVNSAEESKFFIYLNSSTTTNIQFEPPVSIQLPEQSKTSIIATGDLNNDGLTDIAVSNNGQGSLYLFRNQSTSGNVQFANVYTITEKVPRENIAFIDLDNDQFEELVYTTEESNLIEIYKNNSTENGTLSFNKVQSINFRSAFGLDLADVNGDGLNDITASSLTNGLLVIENDFAGNGINLATSKSISLETVNSSSSQQKAVRNILTEDVNNDGRPDFIFAFNSLTGATGELSSIANYNCIVPSISPQNLTFCYDDSFTLTANQIFEGSYSWSTNIPGAIIGATNQEEVELLVPSGSPTEINVTLTIIPANAQCSESTTSTFQLNGGSPPAAPSINLSQSGTICKGDNITLTSSISGDAYLWILPDGSTSSLAQIEILEASEANAGLYELRVQSSSQCYSEPGNVLVDIDIPPAPSIINRNAVDYFCEGQSLTLEIPTLDGYTYQWLLNGTSLNSNNSEYSATSSGDYQVEITSNTTSCSNINSAYNLEMITAPSAMFDSETEICVGVPLTFTAESSGDNRFTLTNTWDFKDGSTTTGDVITHTFETAGIYEVELSTFYNEIELCEDIITMQVEVSDIPTIEITVPSLNSSPYEKCPSDSILIELPANFQSYLWSDGSTSNFTYAKTSTNENSVEYYADVVTNLGCEIRTEIITISNYANSQISIFDNNNTPIESTVELELAQRSITVSAETANGQEYQWRTSDMSILEINELNPQTVTIYPSQAQTEISVRVLDANDCNETRSFIITRPGLQPRNTFSPDGDGINDCWIVANADVFGDCEIVIIDKKGRQIKTVNLPSESSCIWDGKLSNGTDVPEGVYFFVVKCSNNSESLNGTILLVRN